MCPMIHFEFEDVEAAVIADHVLKLFRNDGLAQIRLRVGGTFVFTVGKYER
jgi:hypothetical protein